MYRSLWLFCFCAMIYAIHRAGGKPLALEGEEFQIQSLTWEKCLAYRNPWTKPRISFEPSLTLRKCEKNSTAYAQIWLKTRDGQLRLKGKQLCLTANARGQVFLKPCRSVREYQSQQWECSGNFLKSRNNMYLLPFNLSAARISVFGVIMRSSPRKEQILQTKYGGAEWTKHGNGLSLCENMSKAMY